jgi:hypothetical protein
MPAMACGSDGKGFCQGPCKKKKGFCQGQESFAPLVGNKIWRGLISVSHERINI